MPKDKDLTFSSVFQLINQRLVNSQFHVTQRDLINNFPNLEKNKQVSFNYILGLPKSHQYVSEAGLVYVICSFKIQAVEKERKRLIFELDQHIEGVFKIGSGLSYEELENDQKQDFKHTAPSILLNSLRQNSFNFLSSAGICFLNEPFLNTRVLVENAYKNFDKQKAK